jgi:uncharacterized protein YbgA (DUF1722 family)
LGYFSPALSSDEKAFFLDALQQYRQGTLPLSVPTHLLKGWIVRFGQDYLSTQSYFQPYPQELADLETLTLGGEPGRERDYWKETPPAATQKESSG